jgi:hypothetical protein
VRAEVDMLLSMLAATAMAKDPQWGAGVHLGTWAIPGQYPSSLPKVDPEGDGTKVAMTSVDKVRGDFLFGVEGWFWVDDAFRLGLLPGVDVGSKFGAASSTFRGTQGEEKLVVPNYPLRANIGAMLTPTEFLAPQLRLIGQWNIPSSHRYTTVDGTELDKKQVGTGVYVNVGIELSVLYGNFGK